MAGLTKQHFNKIAEILNKNKIEPITENKTIKKGFAVIIGEKSLFLKDLCNYFKSQNPLFDENRFKKACLE